MESTGINENEDADAQSAAMDPDCLQVPSIVSNPREAGYYSLRSTPNLPTEPNNGNSHLNAGQDGYRSMNSITELLLPAAEPSSQLAVPNSAHEARSNCSQVPLLAPESNDQTNVPLRQKTILVHEKVGGRSIYKRVAVDDDSTPYPEFGPGNPIIQRDPFKLRERRHIGYSGELKVRCFPPLPNAVCRALSPVDSIFSRSVRQ